MCMTFFFKRMLVYSKGNLKTNLRWSLFDFNSSVSLLGLQCSIFSNFFYSTTFIYSARFLPVARTGLQGKSVSQKYLYPFLNKIVVEVTLWSLVSFDHDSIMCIWENRYYKLLLSSSSITHKQIFTQYPINGGWSFLPNKDFIENLYYPISLEDQRNIFPKRFFPRAFYFCESNEL